MDIDSKTIASMAEASQDFSRVAQIADTYGNAIIFKGNRPKYRLIDLEQEDVLELSDDEKIDIVAQRVLNKYRSAFEALAQ